MVKKHGGVRYGLDIDEDTGEQHMIVADKRIPLNEEPQRIVHRPVPIRPANAPAREQVRQEQQERRQRELAKRREEANRRPEQAIRQDEPQFNPYVPMSKEPTQKFSFEEDMPPKPPTYKTDSQMALKVSNINYKYAFDMTPEEFNVIMTFFRNDVEQPILDELFGVRGKNLRINLTRDYEKVSAAFSKLYQKYMPRTSVSSKSKVPNKFFKSTDRVFASSHTFEELTKSIQFREETKKCTDVHKVFTYVADGDLFFKILVEATNYKLIGKYNIANEYVVPEKLQRQIEHDYMKMLNDFLSKSDMPGFKNKINRAKMIIHAVLYDDIYLLEGGTPVEGKEGIAILADPIYGKITIPKLGGNIYDILNLFIKFLNLLPSEVQTTYAEYYMQEFIQGYGNSIDDFQLNRQDGWIASCAPGNFQKTLIGFMVLDSFVDTPVKTAEEIREELEHVDKSVLIDNLKMIINTVYQTLYQLPTSRMTIESLKQAVIENLKRNDNQYLIKYVDEMSEYMKELVQEYENDNPIGGRRRTRKHRKRFNPSKTKKYRKPSKPRSRKHLK